MACDMCTSFMSLVLYAYWASLRASNRFHPLLKRCSPLRIIHQKLPDEMAAGAVIHVAAFAGIKIGCVVAHAANPAIDETMLQVRHGVAFFAARHVCGGNVINACRTRFQ